MLAEATALCALQSSLTVKDSLTASTAYPTRCKDAEELFSISDAAPEAMDFLGGNPIPQIHPPRNEWQVQGRPGEDAAAASYRLLGTTPLDPDFCIEEAWKNSDKQPMDFDALCTIADARKTDTLMMLVVSERSKGAFTLQDLKAAYDQFLGRQANGMQLDGAVPPEHMEDDAVSPCLAVPCEDGNLTSSCSALCGLLGAIGSSREWRGATTAARSHDHHSQVS